MDRKKERGDITNRIILSVGVYILFSIALVAADEFVGWVGAYIVVIAFTTWLIILTEIRKKAGTFNGSLLLF